MGNNTKEIRPQDRGLSSDKVNAIESLNRVTTIIIDARQFDDQRVVGELIEWRSKVIDLTIEYIDKIRNL